MRMLRGPSKLLRRRRPPTCCSSGSYPQTRHLIRIVPTLCALRYTFPRILHRESAKASILGLNALVIISVPDRAQLRTFPFLSLFAMTNELSSLSRPFASSASVCACVRACDLLLEPRQVPPSPSLYVSPFLLPIIKAVYS